MMARIFGMFAMPPARMTEREPADHGPLVGSTRRMASRVPGLPGSG